MFVCLIIFFILIYLQLNFVYIIISILVGHIDEIMGFPNTLSQCVLHCFQLSRYLYIFFHSFLFYSFTAVNII